MLEFSGFVVVFEPVAFVSGAFVSGASVSVASVLPSPLSTREAQLPVAETSASVADLGTGKPVIQIRSRSPLAALTLSVS